MLHKIRRFFLRHFRKMRFLPPKLYTHIHYEYYNKEKLNLKNPITFNAKIAWYKVFYRPKILNQLVDKYAVRDYVRQKIGAQYLNTIYGVYERVEDIDFDVLPNSFVIKATHASGYNLIVKDKSKLDFGSSKKLFRKWLKRNQYYRMGQEWAYKNVKPRLIIEQLLTDKNQKSLIDYKFYCFNGVAKFIDIHMDRESQHKQGCFDLNFKPLPFDKSHKYDKITQQIKKPSRYKEMIKCAEALAENIPFVRVDFYNVNDQIIFGEMTFYPSDGRKGFHPPTYNKIVGDFFTLPKL